VKARLGSTSQVEARKHRLQPASERTHASAWILRRAAGGSAQSGKSPDRREFAMDFFRINEVSAGTGML
jgi:hypothetical protein